MENSNVKEAKSCIGCLYYSSHLKLNSKNPICVGLTLSLPKEPELYKDDVDKAKEEREAHNMYKYVCVGLSAYVDQRGQNSKGQETRTKLPVCVGAKLIKDKPTHRPSNSDDEVHRRPSNSDDEIQEYLSSWKRNANVVAEGVAKNMREAGTQIKKILHDALDAYRKPPK